METKNTYSSVLEQRGNYHPENEYFMIDYIDFDCGSHIRLPFLRKEQMVEVCSEVMEAISEGAHIEHFRVLPESFLDMKPFEDMEEVSEEEQQYTQRELLFDKRYQKMAERFKNNECFFQKNLK